MRGAGGLTTQERLIEQWGRHWTAHDLDQLLTLFTADLVYEDVTAGTVNRTRDELRALGEGFFVAFPDITYELTSRFATGSYGSAEWVMRGTHRGDLPGLPATGRSFQIRGASVFEFAGDKIRRCTEYWDMATFLRQVGAMPGG